MKKLKLFLVLITIFFTISSKDVLAHCDSMNGPVVKAAEKALETGNLNYVLVWVRSEDEKEIKAMFDKVNKVRALGSGAKELADMYFFETVVRVHRMGEGVGYTGLKPAGYKPEEGIEAADMAVENNSTDKILSRLDEKYYSKINKIFNDLQTKKNYRINDLNAGREYVELYVRFIHYIEGLYSGEVNKIEVKHNN